MRILICGAISGIEDYNKPAFDSATERLRASCFFVINPLESVDFHNIESWDFYMLKTLKLILGKEIDMLVFLPGWMDSLGANIERDVAGRMGIKCMEWQELLANGL